MDFILYDPPSLELSFSYALDMDNSDDSCSFAVCGTSLMLWMYPENLCKEETRLYQNYAFAQIQIEYLVQNLPRNRMLHSQNQIFGFLLALASIRYIGL